MRSMLEASKFSGRKRKRRAEELERGGLKVYLAKGLTSDYISKPSQGPCPAAKKVNDEERDCQTKKKKIQATMAN